MASYRNGNSLKCWEEYFPNAKIYGIDIQSTNKNRHLWLKYKLDEYTDDGSLNIKLRVQ